MALSTWPPPLDELKIDAKIDDDDTRDDNRLEQTLAAAVAFVERVHVGRYDFTTPPGVLLPAPPIDMLLGTIRLAVRWHDRRRSPDALIALGELGASRVPSFDVDIDRMLRIGRYAPAVFA